jgi:hypothetical protein
MHVAQAFRIPATCVHNVNVLPSCPFLLTFNWRLSFHVTLFVRLSLLLLFAYPILPPYLRSLADLPSLASEQLLPANVVPLHYDLSITPDLETFVFKGTVRIDLDVKTSTDNIELHGLDVVLTKVLLALS